jgi:hypothetical protein
MPRRLPIQAAHAPQASPSEAPPVTPESRQSGVRASALRLDDAHDVDGANVKSDFAVDLFETDEDAVPTVRPQRMKVKDVRDDLAPLHELLYRFEVGDHKGALAAAESLLDRSLVPIILIPTELLPAMVLDPRAALLVTCVDGRTSLEAVLEASTLPMLDGLRALCELLDRGVVALR